MMDPQQFFRMGQSHMQTQQQRQINEQLRIQNAHIARELAKDKCPYCKGRVESYASICQHCGNQLGWVWQDDPDDGFRYFTSCVPGQEQMHIPRLQQLLQNRRNAISARKRRLLIVWLVILFLFVPFVMTFVTLISM